MSLYRFAIVVSLAASLTGCINSGTIVRVKPDGSGTIEQTTLVNLQALKGVMASMGAPGQMKESMPGMLNEAEFKRTAERIGARPVSVTPLKEGGFEGAKAVFAFDDITKVRVDQDPGMGGAAAAKLESAGATKNPIRFGFTKQGGSSVLTINFDEKQAEAAVSKADTKPMPNADEIDPAMLQMVKTMFQGFKIAIDLEVDGTIVKTNADYVNGSRVTLLELDMAGLFEDEAKLKALQSKIGPGASIAEIKPYLKDVKGVKINHPSLTIEYR
jgi:hypothetical protein